MYYIRIDMVMSTIISKIKNILIAKKREVILFLIFFLISSLSFGLGYLYAKDHNIAPIIIQKIQ
jgi:hypothetical protein